VPPKESGGDGQHSITWLEVRAARDAGKPVYGFVVDPRAPWTALREEDRLRNEPENAAEILQAVQGLRQFKQELGTPAYFSNEDDLATKVVATLARFAPHAPARAAARAWQPLFCHALQPAQHFRGRHRQLSELTEWLESPVTPDRVLSLVAAGGTGKTALANKAISQARFSGRAGVFVWSFYEDARTDAFLSAAYGYFTGEHNEPVVGMLERMQIALSGDLPHILILDGLELIQSEGGTHPRGAIEDMMLKRLLRSLAGGVGGARALVTSRFPLVDLENMTGVGHRVIPSFASPAISTSSICSNSSRRIWRAIGSSSTISVLSPITTQSGSSTSIMHFSVMPSKRPSNTDGRT
jgi:hypothetical protein